MQLTRHTDYALRLLIHLAHAAPDARVQVAEVADAHRISKAHLLKVANHLARLGFVETARGRGGGLRLARPASDINLAEVVCGTELGTTLVQCGGCGLIAGGCRLPGIFAEGFEAFRTVLARHSLADLMARPDAFFAAPQAAAAS
ncbi:MAG TPA: Rrf2 family transcriptional regulator [Novosphingobium sp.]|nr:Rrf2 family transcriptional regulator [Novosphingobium sp.]